MNNDVWNECIFDFRNIPVKCDNCGSNKVRYTSNKEVYGRVYGNGAVIYVMIVKLMWVCTILRTKSHLED